MKLIRRQATLIQKEKLFFLILFALTLFLYSPILINPKVVLERNNDLTGFFWPIFHFAKQQILENRSLPLWNNLFLSGTPLLPDPQSPLFYLPNMMALFLPIDQFFLTTFFLHALFGGIGAYLVGKHGFGFSKPAALFVAVLYIFSPRLAGYLEAGHFGLVTSFAWIPFVLLATIKIAKKPQFSWSLLLAVSLAAVFFTHTITFTLLSILSFGVFLGTMVFLKQQVSRKKSFLFFLIGTLMAAGLTSITLLPQLAWLPYTTRFLLTQTPDVYPKWQNLQEFVNNVFLPGLGGTQNIWATDSEKWLALGVITPILALIGLRLLPPVVKLTFVISGFILAIVSLNNISPLSNFLLSQNWYLLMRVSTRVWFIVVLATIFLAGLGFEFLLKKNRRMGILLAILAITEMLAFSWTRMNKPVTIEHQIPQEAYEFLNQDQEKSRIFCVNRCISQKLAAQNGLELVEGYNTLQQLNYYKHMWQLTGKYWNYYTLSLPPEGTYTFEEIHPDAVSLGEFNVKYVISPYKLSDKNFELKKETGGYLIYQNKQIHSRAYFWTDDQKPGYQASILQYTPNFIRVDTSGQKTSRLVLAEVWSPGWNAYLDGKRKVAVQEKPNTLRLVDIKPDTEFVDFRYEPKSYNIGKTITFVTLIAIIGILLHLWKVSFNSPGKRNFS